MAPYLAPISRSASSIALVLAIAAQGIAGCNNDTTPSPPPKIEPPPETCRDPCSIATDCAPGFSDATCISKCCTRFGAGTATGQLDISVLRIPATARSVEVIVYERVQASGANTTCDQLRVATTNTKDPKLNAIRLAPPQNVAPGVQNIQFSLTLVPPGADRLVLGVAYAQEGGRGTALSRACADVESIPADPHPRTKCEASPPSPDCHKHTSVTLTF